MALLTGLIAKEMVVSSLSMFYGFALTATSAQVAAAMTGFTPCPPSPCWCSSCCMSPAWRRCPPWLREMNSVKWTLFSIAWQLGMAYIAAFLVHTVGLLLGFLSCVSRSSADPPAISDIARRSRSCLLRRAERYGVSWEKSI